MPQNEGVLDKVKRTFMRMASAPFEQDGAAKLDPLITMNYPALMGRRDAACDRALKLMRENLFARGENERCEVYGSILKLLDCALECTETLRAPGKRNLRPIEKEHLYASLTLLRDVVASALGLVLHEKAFASSERDLGAFLGSQAAESFRAADEIVSDSEINVFHCAAELAEQLVQAIGRHREQCKRAFDKLEIDRYDKAFGEYGMLFSRVGSLQ